MTKSSMNKLIVGLLIGIFIGGIGGYFISGTINKPNQNFPSGNFQGFQIDDATKQEVISFFENTNDINKITSYCAENRINCFYYCMEVNQDHEVCNEIMVPSNNDGPSNNEFGDRG